MSRVRYRPKRRLRSEIFPLVVIMSLPVALYLSFPSGAVGFRPAGASLADHAVSAFVSLTPEREAQLLSAARASWQSDSANRRGVRADLLDCGTPSVAVAVPLVSLPRAARRDVPAAEAEYEVDFLPVGMAADPPKRLAAQEESVPAPAFPESDLLKLN